MDHKILMKVLAKKIRSIQQDVYDPDTGSKAVVDALEVVADISEELANMTEGEIMYFLEIEDSLPEMAGAL
jgi:hypothetical protein